MRQYEPPVQIECGDIVMGMHQQRDNEVIAVLEQAVGVRIDKNELIRAIKHERDQYRVGYNDGRLDLSDSILHKLETVIADTQRVCGNTEFVRGMKKAMRIVDKELRRGDSP